MPYTFTGASTNRFTWSLRTAPTASSGAIFAYEWVYPTTLTAGNRFWSNASITGIEVDTTTTQLRLKEQHTTTSGEWTTSDAGLATNKWSFLAWFWSPAAAGGAWRVWAGAVDTAPTELTVTSAVASSGSHTSSVNMTVGNVSSGSAGHAGDIAEFGYLQAVVSTTKAPFFLAGAGAITDAEADLTYRRLVLPAWQGKWVPPHVAVDAASGGWEVGRLVLDTLAALLNVQAVNVSGNINQLAPTIVGATVSKNGHPRPPLSSQLFSPSRRR